VINGDFDLPPFNNPPQGWFLDPAVVPPNINAGSIPSTLQTGNAYRINLENTANSLTIAQSGLTGFGCRGVASRVGFYFAVTDGCALRVVFGFTDVGVFQTTNGIWARYENVASLVDNTLTLYFTAQPATAGAVVDCSVFIDNVVIARQG
jgi:hypothetical protein